MTDKIPLFGKTLSDVQEIVNELKLPKFTAKQIIDWLYKKEISSIDEMSNLSIKARELLKVNYTYGLTKPTDVRKSKDGTKKYTFKIAGKGVIETAFIPGKERATLCVSSQVGCRYGCKFCMTGKQGFKGDLTAGEIVNQLRSIPEFKSITNIVYMGMGEPLDNYNNVMKSIEIITSEYGIGMSTRRITLSTVGLVKELRKFVKESKVNLALSLHNPFPAQRARMMPVENKNPMTKIVAIIKDSDYHTKLKFTVEYTVFKGINDSPEHVKELAKLFSGMANCRINLIPYNDTATAGFSGVTTDHLESMQHAIMKRGVTATVRRSRGMDIEAACGMLAGKKK